MKKKVTKTTTTYKYDEKGFLLEEVRKVEEYEVDETPTVVSGEEDEHFKNAKTGTIKAFKVATGVPIRETPYATFDPSGNAKLYGELKGIEITDSVALAILEVFKKLEKKNSLHSNKPF